MSCSDDMKSYRHYLIYTAPSAGLAQFLASRARVLSEYKDDQGPYYYVFLKKCMSVQRMKKLTGCTDVRGLTVVPSHDALREMTRSNVARAKKEYDEQLKRGHMLLEVLKEDNTPEEVLCLADRRAIRAYKKSVDGKVDSLVNTCKTEVFEEQVKD